MKHIKLSKTSEISKRTLIEYNRSVDAWQKKDEEMSALLDTQREKKHLAKNMFASLDIRTLSRSERDQVLRKILSKARKDHVRDIKQMMDKIALERKKRANSRYSTGDVSQVLQLNDINADLKKAGEKRNSIKVNW